MSAQDEEDVLAELAAMQAEQVRLLFLSSSLDARAACMPRPARVDACEQGTLTPTPRSQTSTKLPEAPTHALPQVERPAVVVDADADEEDERQAARARPERQLVAA